MQVMADGTEKLPTGPLHGDQTAKTLSGVGGQRDEKNAGKASIFCMAVSRLIQAVWVD